MPFPRFSKVSRLDSVRVCATGVADMKRSGDQHGLAIFIACVCLGSPRFEYSWHFEKESAARSTEKVFDQQAHYEQNTRY